MSHEDRLGKLVAGDPQCTEIHRIGLPRWVARCTAAQTGKLGTEDKVAVYQCNPDPAVDRYLKLSGRADGLFTRFVNHLGL